MMMNGVKFLICTLLLTIIPAIQGVLTPAPNKQFRYQVGFQPKSTTSLDCEGVVLTQNWILTVAKCVQTMSAADTSVWIGSQHVLQNGLKYSINRIVKHPDYNDQNQAHNIALVKLTDPIAYSDNVVNAKIQKQDAPLTGDENATLSGWATTGFVIQMIDTFQISNASCKGANGISSSSLRPYEFCGTDSSPDSSQVCIDNYGSLVTRDGVLLGLSSKKNLCPALPQVFTKVSYYSDWISKTLENDAVNIKWDTTYPGRGDASSINPTKFLIILLSGAFAFSRLVPSFN